MNISEYRISDIRRKLDISDICPLDVMITGVTGAGKSTTLNAIFEKTVANVGDGVDPETMSLDAYRLNDWLRLWDTPGLGDGQTKDTEHKKNMVKLLRRNFVGGRDLYGFIDLVIIVIEGTKRDLGTTTTLIEDVILPNIESNRVLVAINQADVAMKGRYWNVQKNCPDLMLKKYLDDFAQSLQQRIRRDTGLNIPRPIYYSAEKEYNIKTFMDLIIDNIPTKSRNPIDIIKQSGDSSSISLINPTYDYFEEDKVVAFYFDRLENDSSWRNTGELEVDCWISDGKFDMDEGWSSDNHHLIGTRLLGHLKENDYFSETNCYFKVPSDLPIHGYWNFVFTINELSDDGRWYIIEYRNAEGGYN